MKTRNKLAFSCLIAMMALCSFIQAGVVSLANNHKDVGFDFWYVADGSDYAVAPLAKQDNTASYVKSNAGTHEFTTWICGTNKNSADPYSMNYCSNSVRIASGSYRYISNTVYGKFKNAFPMITIGQDNKQYYISGKWSPDNISGRY